MPREVVGGGHRPLAVAHRAIGGEELHRLRRARASQGNGTAAQHIGEQVGQRAVGAHGHALPIDVVVFGRGDRASTEHRLAVAIKGDSVGDSASVHPLQHAVAFIVVEEAIAGRRATGRRPTGQASFVVIAHQRARRAAATGMPTGRVGVAAGHVAHGIIASIGIGYTAQGGRRVHVIDVAIGDAARWAAGHAIQAVIAEGLLVGGQGSACGSIPTVIASAGRAGVATGGRDGRGQLEHVAHVVVGAPLAPDGAAPHAGAGRLRTLDAILTHVGEALR